MPPAPTFRTPNRARSSPHRATVLPDSSASPSQLRSSASARLIAVIPSPQPAPPPSACARVHV
ncbi:hypothetical protein IEQ34_014869 [Dendrobium chrysotoxum]|uniref:Uncharacterized protein n=1 Tax=Dendrobium chrysotoxum TaxID=161865 RepID=A0AAV7GN51_DENCH|nr:hypothetical protein IEQ34_014869 [Dendrobium chrysotoxum]